MLIQTRLFLALLALALSATLPIGAAQAQSAVANQAAAQLNQVQQDLQAGLINQNQANDLIKRYSDIMLKSQQWSAQDGGNLNVPDRLDLQGQLKRSNKRLVNSLQNGGLLTGGVASQFFNANALNNGSAYNNANALYGANNFVNGPIYGTSSLASADSSYGASCHHHHRGYGHSGYDDDGDSRFGNRGYGNSAYGLGGYGNNLGNLANRQLNGYGNSFVNPVGLTNANYGTLPYGNGSGLVQGLLGQLRSRGGYGSF